ncbi:MAG TPA: radical SAM family heme chaperone HemW [Flavobacteriales bacterium]|nr:radical SAM family heme chaperone HemW [Flavobacteriales bacterium]
MSGLYFHIPFCHRACTYCDFHFSTSLRTKEPVLAAMRKELAARAQELEGASLGSIYFGGGTPSILSKEELGSLLGDVRRLATVEPDAEITLEANPEDVSEASIESWQALGINRVSLGIQSFRDDCLRWMNRLHDAARSLRAIDIVSRSGMRTWTIDLIYGLPGMDIGEWDEQIRIALDHGMPHLSAYCLTVERRTALHHQIATGKVQLPTDADQAAQFGHLIDRMEAAGLVQYEISNFGREGHFAVHNTNYWRGVPYLGIGPAAHSFSGSVRRWNVANNVRYADGVEKGLHYWEEEALTPVQQLNEKLFTGLRTMWGVPLAELGDEFREVNAATIARYLALDELQIRDGRLMLTLKGRNFADRIASDLFMPGP